METQDIREIAFKTLYEAEVRESKPSDIVIDETLGNKANEFIKMITDGVEAKNDEYNNIISENLKGWKLERVSKLSITAIKLALSEMENNPKVTPAIAIAEAVRLANKYEGDEASSFVNGVLGNYIRGKSN